MILIISKNLFYHLNFEFINYVHQNGFLNMHLHLNFHFHQTFQILSHNHINIIHIFQMSHHHHHQFLPFFFCLINIDLHHLLILLINQNVIYFLFYLSFVHFHFNIFQFHVYLLIPLFHFNTFYHLYHLLFHHPH